MGDFSGDVRAQLLRGADTPDYFSTQPTGVLQTILRETPTLPVESLINTGRVRFDFEQKRVFRDSFWKGSFAKDTLLGWEERIRDAVFGNSGTATAGVFAGGSFWKRFDHIENGVVAGYVVNYEIRFLPGDPRVKQVSYPDDNRRYFKKGDSVLLLNYLNAPYRIVYDTIKVIDNDDAVGVMHLGSFPTGVEFATFVMARNNYPFEKMSVEDYRLLRADPRTTVPAAPQLVGSWTGNLIVVSHPDATLLNQFNPVVFHVTFSTSGSDIQARYRFGFFETSAKVAMTDEFVRVSDSESCGTQIRMIDSDYMIGKWSAAALDPRLARGLRNFVEPAGTDRGFYYVLSRARLDSGAA